MENTTLSISNEELYDETLIDSNPSTAAIGDCEIVSTPPISTTADVATVEVKIFTKKTGFSKFRENIKNRAQVLRRFRTMFIANRRRNEILLFLSLCCSFLSTFLHSSSLAGGRLQLRKQPPPRRFFSANSPVRDLYDGNEVMLHNILSQSELAIVMYYAPWSTACVEAKFHFDRLSRTFGRNVDFVAVNCWDPGGHCRKLYKIFSYPIIILYSAATGSRGIYYNHVLSADYMYRYLLNALQPLVRLTCEDEVNQRLSSGNVHVVGYFDLSHQGGLRFYESFYYVSMRALENDALRDRISFSAITDFSAAQYFNLTGDNAIRIFHKSLLDGVANTLYTVASNRSSYDVNDLLNWIFDKNAQKVDWYHTRHAKDENLLEIFNENPTLVLFTPRRPLFDAHHDQFAFSEAALRYFDCQNGSSRDLWLNAQASILALKSKFSKFSEFWSEFRTKNCPDFRTKNAERTCGSIIKTFYANGTCGKSFSSNQGSDQCSVKNDKYSYGPDITDSGLQCSIFASQSINNYRNYRLKFSKSNSVHDLNCGVVKLAEWLKYPSLNLHGNPSRLSNSPPENLFKSGILEKFEIDRLSCGSNKTLNFVMIDSDHEKFHAEKMGVNLNQYGSAVAIIDAKAETIFAMPHFKRLSVARLNHFVVNYTRGTLARHKKSQNGFGPVGSTTVDCGSSENGICIEQITAKTFEKRVLDCGQDVVLMYQVPWCGLCQQIYHVFQMVSFYFRSLRDQLQFAIIDADQNDLPWQYTVDLYPTILYFKANRSGDTSVYPRTLPYNLPNLISFVLSRMDWSDRLHFSFGLCSKKCLMKNLLIVERLERRHTRTLARWLLWARSKAYLWTWQDNDPDFGPYVPRYMEGVWTSVGRSRVKIRALRFLRQLILHKIKNFRIEANALE